MPAVDLDLVIEQGATWSQTFIYKDSNLVPINLSAYSARMQIRQTIPALVVLLSLTTANGRITLDATGHIFLLVDAATTALLNWTGSARYDLELVNPLNPDYVIRLLQGHVHLTKEVTR
jgi:hypothetical protein